MPNKETKQTKKRNKRSYDSPCTYLDEFEPTEAGERRKRLMKSAGRQQNIPYVVRAMANSRRYVKRQRNRKEVHYTMDSEIDYVIGTWQMREGEATRSITMERLEGDLAASNEPF